MQEIVSPRLPSKKWLRTASIVAVLFGLLSVFSGGMVLIVGGSAREAAGNYVPFVLWFNFLAGFGYVAAGLGLWWARGWGAWLSAIIAGLTLLVFASFGAHILTGGSYEVRTLWAMIFRSGLWLVIAVYSWRFMGRGMTQAGDHSAG
jgi:hypothetical protein